MATVKPIRFVDNSDLRGEEAQYATLTVRVPTVLKSWKSSLFSFEWLRADGTLKDVTELPHHLRERREAIENKLAHGEALEKPVLGIGMLESIEIGIGRDVFLTLAAHGVAELPVHVPATMIAEFAAYKV